MNMRDLELTPCLHCKKPVFLPFLCIGDMIFCNWTCYANYKHPRLLAWEQLELAFNERALL